MKNLFLLFALVLFIVSCSKDESNTSNNQDAIMEVEKDGVLFTITDFNNTLIEDSQGNEIGRRLDLRSNVDNGTLIISISNWDWQNPPESGVLIKSYDTNSDENGPNTVCTSDSSYTYCDSGLGTYLINTEVYVSEVIDDENEGIITISSNDSEKKTVSGTFDFATKKFGSNEKISFEGSFMNLPYR